jgi:formylglycine-generating enzyme required for sulfatase activity
VITGDHYWRYVRPGTYQIGGWGKGDSPADIVLPGFWLARFPLTVAQYAPFVADGYGKDAARWWTREGWIWKRKKRTQPWGWDRPEYCGPNQPVIGVNWYEATAFCAWLTEQLQDALPKDYEIRLPTEAEWEAAAYDAQMHRQTYPWSDDKPTPERAIYDASKLDRPAPVGCCPGGAAPCGTLDMVGNVWEWMMSSFKGYPAQSGGGKDFTSDDYDVPLRGGSWQHNSSYACYGTRYRGHPDAVNLPGNVMGVRVCVAPQLARE